MTLIHADGTECHHKRQPQATVHDDSGPLCAAGQPVTHIQIGGQTMTVAEACTALLPVVQAVGVAFSQIVASVTEWANKFASDPAIRALAGISDEYRHIPGAQPADDRDDDEL